MTPLIPVFVANGMLKGTMRAKLGRKYYFCFVKLQNGNHSGSTFEND